MKTKVMPTLRFTAADHGLAVSDWDFDIAEFEEGYKFELIDGRLYVAAEPDPQEECLNDWMVDVLKAYMRRHRHEMNKVSFRARVFVPSRERITVPEPDIACYCDYPTGQDLKKLKWVVVNPFLVVEILVNSNPEKDLVRNYDLYLQVPTIREYWVVDGRIDSLQPQLIQHRRHGGRWVVRTYEAGSTFTTKLLPGFELVLDPLAE